MPAWAAPCWPCRGRRCTSRRTHGGRGSRQRQRHPPGRSSRGPVKKASGHRRGGEPSWKFWRVQPAGGACTPLHASAPWSGLRPPAPPAAGCSPRSALLCAADGRAGSFLHHVLSTVLALAKQLQAAAGCTRNASQHGAAHRSQHPGGGCHWLSMAGAQLESLVTFHFPEHKIGGAGPCIPPAQPAAASAHALCLLNRDGSYIAAATTDGGCRPH